MNKNTIKCPLIRKSKKLLNFSGKQVDFSLQFRLEGNVKAFNAELPLFTRISYRYSWRPWDEDLLS